MVAQRVGRQCAEFVQLLQHGSAHAQRGGLRVAMRRAQRLWDNQTKTATLQVGARTAVLRIRENEAQLDGAPLPLDARLRIVRGRVLIPASALREILDAELLYDGATGQVVINTGRE